MFGQRIGDKFLLAMKPWLTSSLVLAIALGWLVRVGGCAVAHAGVGSSTLITKIVATPKKFMVATASLPCQWETNDVATFRDFVMVEASPKNRMITNRIVISPTLPSQFFRGVVVWPITNAVGVVASWSPDGFWKLFECLNPDGVVVQAFVTMNKTQKTFVLNYCYPTNNIRCTNLDAAGNPLGSVTVQYIPPPLTLTATLTSQHP